MVGSFKDHCAVVSAGLLHQLHTYMLVADWVPVAIGRSFQVSSEEEFDPFNNRSIFV